MTQVSTTPVLRQPIQYNVSNDLSQVKQNPRWRPGVGKRETDFFIDFCGLYVSYVSLAWRRSRE
jgi:hypothetical protein